MGNNEQITFSGVLKPKKELSFEAELLVSILKNAKGPVSRSTLIDEIGSCDRRIRRLIAEARDYGFIIVNNGDGYYITADIDEIERWYRKEKRRALTILRRIRRTKAMLNGRGRSVA